MTLRLTRHQMTRCHSSILRTCHTILSMASDHIRKTNDCPFLGPLVRSNATSVMHLDEEISTPEILETNARALSIFSLWLLLSDVSIITGIPAPERSHENRKTSLPITHQVQVQVVHLQVLHGLLACNSDTPRGMICVPVQNQCNFEALDAAPWPRRSWATSVQSLQSLKKVVKEIPQMGTIAC